ncbi:MAG TPA: hypothetical protein PKC24_01490 [Cyclobacteriaceae bacterium]|nr:hypothetical protein [Cyclobacteriaceae bacterium]
MKRIITIGVMIILSLSFLGYAIYQKSQADKMAEEVKQLNLQMEALKNDAAQMKQNLEMARELAEYERAMAEAARYEAQQHAAK